MIVQAKAAFDLFESIGPAAAFTDRGQRLLSQVDVLKILEVAQDGLAGVPGFRAAGAFGQSFEALFDFGGETDREHLETSAIQV
jgi:hypothetical protein